MADSSDYNESFENNVFKQKKRRRLNYQSYAKKKPNCCSTDSDSSDLESGLNIRLANSHNELSARRIQNHSRSRNDLSEVTSQSEGEDITILTPDDSPVDSPDDSESEKLEDENLCKLFVNSNTTYSEFLFALYAVKMKHKLSDKSVTDILILIKSLLPQPNKVPKSMKSFDKLVEKKDIGNFHELCLNCNEIKRSDSLDNFKLNCFNCDKCNVETYKFITYNIQKQLYSILTDDSINQIRNSLYYAYKDKREINNALDGQVYKKFLAEKNTNRNLVISINLNTDGAQIVRSRGYNMWPLLGTIVELNQSTRESFNNMVLFGKQF